MKISYKNVATRSKGSPKELYKAETERSTRWRQRKRTEQRTNKEEEGTSDPGIDNILSKVLKNLDLATLDKSLDFTQNTCNIGQIPKSFVKCQIIPIPNKDYVTKMRRLFNNQSHATFFEYPI